MRLRISARKSDLARLQAYMVGEALQKTDSKIEIEYRFKESLGDINLTDPLWKMPEKGVFTEDFYGELLRNETDMVVHSWKDLPTELKSDTQIVATLPRADQRDLLLVKKSHLEKISSSKTLNIFSSSPRREYNLTGFLKDHLPLEIENVQFLNVRGNIPTRMRKLLESSDIDGLVLAKAALDRLLSALHAEFSEMQSVLKKYMAELQWVVLPLTVNPNAAGQGALAIEIRSDRSDLKELLSEINDVKTFECATKEREILASYGGGCHQKIGVSVIDRPYGKITVTKGLTDSGQVLNSRILNSVIKKKWPVAKMWCAENDSAFFRRVEIPDIIIPADVSTLYVARAEAWPSNFTFSGFVWASGLKTWKKLVAKGIWVHGCSESLGEDEPIGIEVLAGQKLSWLKLSHSKTDSNNALKHIATYKLISQNVEINFSGKESFFWSSGSQFLLAIDQHPDIAKRQHACGPGHTYQVVRRHADNVQIFLDQQDWKQRCSQ